METKQEYKTIARKLSNQAKGAVISWFIRRDGFTPIKSDDLYVTWIAKVGPKDHFKAHVELRNAKDSNGQVWDVDIYENGDRAITSYQTTGFVIYNIHNNNKSSKNTRQFFPQLIGFDDSLI